MGLSTPGVAATKRQGVAMIKRAVRFATLMTAIAVPALLGVQGTSDLKAHAAGDAAGWIAPSVQNPQGASVTAMGTQSFWHLMALSSR
jgi:hypothetical protein